MEKGLNCNICIHKNVCEHKETSKRLWDDLTLIDKFQDLQNRGFTITPTCINYNPDTPRPKIIGGNK